ncbi:hypothetical protein B0H14DRAFT_3166040 [Mycena olivaceomarginata]|nr:hypothetical protein B0H14DRAFT_3166040 [Mycena olivaceomarginata]
MNLPYRLDHFTGEGDCTRLWVRSLACTGSAGMAQPECASCRAVKVGQTLATLETRAESAPSHTPCGYLNQKQLIHGWRAATADKNEQHLKMLTMTKKAARSTSRMGGQKRLIMVLSTCDIPRLSTLMRVAAKQRVGPKKMIKCINDAANALSPGGYRPKDFTDTEKKLMRCMKRFAGRKGVYALSKGLGLPSASTEIGTNIRTFFGAASPNSTLPRAGHTLMIDGVHLSQRACWHRPTNQIIGLCREYSEPFNLAMNDMESVLKIVDAVHGDSPTCHYGREATVLAIGPYRERNYHGVCVPSAGPIASLTGSLPPDEVRPGCLGLRSDAAWSALPAPSALEVPAKRTHGALTLLNVGGCDGCAKPITEAEKGDMSKVTECSKKGCETRWFHRECTDGLKEKLPKNWACDLCCNAKRRRA